MRVQFGLLISVSLLAACSSDDSTTSTPSTASTVPDVDALSAAYDSLGNEDETWNLDAVLSIFAARNGDLPGVEPADELTASLLDDQALADVLSKRLEDLAPEVGAVVEAWLFPGPAEETHTYVFTDSEVVEMIDGVEVPVVVPSLTELGEPPLVPNDEPLPVLDTLAPDLTGGPTRVPHGAPAPQYHQRALAYLQVYQALSGHYLARFEFDVEIGPTARNVSATALPYNDRLGCKIRLSSRGAAGSDTVAHEVYHCFQFGVRVPLGLHAYNEPRWVMEGTASYAGIEMSPGPWKDGWYRVWTTLQRPLNRRAYDAIGFYETLEIVGLHDMWRFMVHLLKTDAPSSVLSSELKESDYGYWGGQLHDNLALGDFFYFRPYAGQGPYVREVTVAVGAPPIVLAVPAMSSRAFSVRGAWGDDVLVVERTVSGVAAVGETVARLIGRPVRLCFSDIACSPCPASAAVRLNRVSGDVVQIGVASVGGGDIRVSLVGHDSICNPVPAGTGTCPVGTWLVDNTVMASAFQAITAVPGAPPGNQAVEGAFSMQVNADGTMTVSATDWTITSEQQGPAGTPPLLFESVFNGATSGTWTADATTFTANTTGAFGGRAYITIGHTRTEVTGPQLPNLPVGTGTSNYVCTPEGGLVLRARVPGAVDVTFNRSG